MLDARFIYLPTAYDSASDNKVSDCYRKKNATFVPSRKLPLSHEFSMKICLNRFVLVALLFAVSLAIVGCKGAGTSGTPANLFAKRSTTPSPANPVSTNGTETANSGGSATKGSSSDVALASYATKGSSSDVALASYVSRSTKSHQAQWLNSYDEAVKLSAQTGRPILADFTGSNWCGYCVKLKKEVFDTPEFSAWAAENVVLLELDFPRPNKQPDWIKKQNNQLRNRYEIESYPTVLILNADGSVIGSQGYMRGGPERWVAVADNTVKANRALQKTKFVNAADLPNLK